MVLKLISLFLTGAVICTATFAETDFSESEELTITPQGYGAFEFGQIAHGHYRAGADQYSRTISHVLQQRLITNFGLKAQYKDFLKIEFIGEGMMAFSNPQIGSEPTTMQPRNFYYIKSSNALLTTNDLLPVKIDLQVGYFPYKYNPDVRNLGEYLLRSIPYPMVIMSEFDYPQATLLGMRFNQSIFDNLISNDMLLHSETVVHPVQNWSFTDIVSVNLFDMFSIGGGISLYHKWSAYPGEQIYGSVNSKFNPKNLSPEERAALDTVIPFEATKLMSRISINPQQILNKFIDVDLDFLGKNAFKTYGEFVFLGTDSFPVDYANKKDRMIWTYGINFPGFHFSGFDIGGLSIPEFNLIDLVNLEMEYCENRTAFSDANFYTDKPSLRPLQPGIDPESATNARIKRDPWRWSWYFKKNTCNDHLNFIVQLARDHKKINYYYFAKKDMSFEETLPTKDDWWWTFKTEFKF